MAAATKEDTSGASDDEQDAQKPKSKKKLVFIGVTILVLLGAGAGGFFFLAPQDEDFASAKQEPEKESNAKAKDSDNESYVVAPFKEIIVNISSITARGDATSRFLKLNIALVYDPGIQGAERLAERQVFIRDSYIDFLRQLSENDLNGSAGLAQLKGELLHRARLLAETDAPKEILIADMVIQ